MKNTLNPVWQPFSIPVRALCNGDYDRSASTSVALSGARGMSEAPSEKKNEVPEPQNEETEHESTGGQMSEQIHREKP